MKRIITMIAAMIVCISAAMAQTTTKHVVERGETLTSIAARYGTSEAEIVRLNPEAAQFIYVGMELAIPASSLPTQENTAPQNSLSDDAATSTTYTSYDETDTPQRWTVVSSGSYGFLPKAKVPGTKSESAYSLELSVGVNFFIYRGLYVGARIGYMTTSSSFRLGKSDLYTTENQFIEVPVELGYKLSLHKNFSIIPFAGITSAFLLKNTLSTGVGKYEEKVNNTKNCDTYHAFGRLGARLNLWGFDLGFAYNFPFSKETLGDSKGFPEITIGFSF